MTKYYCIVFVDKRAEVLNGTWLKRHPSHGYICQNGPNFHIYTDKEAAMRVYKNHGQNQQYWRDCFELWEFEL